MIKENTFPFSGLPSRLDYRMRTWWFTYLTFVALHGIFLHVAQCRKKRQRAQTPVRCEAGSHTFYHHQAGACLQCDTCTEGYSLVPEQVQCSTMYFKTEENKIQSSIHASGVSIHSNMLQYLMVSMVRF